MLSVHERNMFDFRKNVDIPGRGNKHEESVSAEEMALNLWHMLHVSMSCGYLHELITEGGQVVPL